MEQKKKKAEKPISPNTGCQMFDGNLTLRLWGGKELQVRCEYCGMDLQRASQEHQIVMLIKQHLTFNELDFGWLVRSKAYDEKHIFGLKAKKSDRSWSVYEYKDVVAWGYVDGGLNNPKHFNSCRMRPEEYPQFAGQPEDDADDYEYDDIENEDRRCVKFRYQDGEIHYNAVVASGEQMKDNATDLMCDAGKTFYEFRQQHPEVTEMHFYTDELVQMND